MTRSIEFLKNSYIRLFFLYSYISLSDINCLCVLDVKKAMCIINYQ